MPDHSLYLGGNFGIITAPGLDWFLKDSDFVWRYHTVISAALRLGNTLLESNQSMFTAETCFRQLSNGRVVGDHDGEILQPIEKLFR